MDLFKVLHRLKIISFLKRWRLLDIILGSLDILAIVAAFQLSYGIYYNTWESLFTEDQILLQIFIFILPAWLLILYLIKVTEIPRTKRYRMLFFEYLFSAFIIAMLLVIIYFAFRLYTVPRQLLVYTCFMGFSFLFLIRFLEYKLFKNYRARGYNLKNIVIIADESSIPFIENLLTYKEWGYNIQTIFTESPEITGKYEETVITLPGLFMQELHNLIEVDLIDEVIYYKKNIVASEVRNIIRSCEELGVTFHVHLKDKDNNLSNAVMTKLAGEDFLTFSNVPYKSISLTAKRLMDMSVSILMIVFFLPFMIITSFLIKFSSAGPVIFRQERIGLRGRKFNLYKFRTMVMDAEKMREELEGLNEADGPAFKIEDDPRVTGIGKFLRRTGLDELPQLFNILKGEMSLIGPRPPLHNETKQYKRWQLRRLSVKPGLSCFWQIKPERLYIKFEKWMEMDLAYIDNWSFRLDLLILFRTIKTFFTRINQ
ncbi:MAG TPA: sugar transferase [Bacteroidetes bacterium]|nr:sugar transferase [Bacteroidota bacterium]